jgi:hypothetical protein
MYTTTKKGRWIYVVDGSGKRLKAGGRDYRTRSWLDAEKAADEASRRASEIQRARAS